jgi:hypothetical protein
MRTINSRLLLLSYVLIGNELFRTDVDAGGVGVDLRVEGRSALARRAGSFGSTVTLSFSFAHRCA